MFIKMQLGFLSFWVADSLSAGLYVQLNGTLCDVVNNRLSCLCFCSLCIRL